MKFSSLKLKAILFLVLIAFTFASDLSRKSHRRNRKSKSMKISRRISARRTAI